MKPIEQQTIVITGASSGIGLATAKMAAKRGAKVVLFSRNTEDLHSIVEDIRNQGGSALAVSGDVSKMDDLRRLRDEALNNFGTIDTWVNNAGVSIYGPLLEIPYEEEKRLFETNFWGVRNGCRIAVPILEKKGGVIINLGSEVSQRAILLQGIYSASKHAVKAYTDALRMELERENKNVSVCLIRPTGIDTPYTEHAPSHLKEGEPSLPDPTYHPDVVAESILKCAVKPQRDVYVGGSSKLFAVLDILAPKLSDLMIEKMMFDEQIKGSKVAHKEKNEGLMHHPKEEGKIVGGHKGKVRTTSAYTSLTTSPLAKIAAGSLAIAGIGALVQAIQKRQGGGSRAILH